MELIIILELNNKQEIIHGFQLKEQKCLQKNIRF